MSLAIVGCTTVDIILPRLRRLPAWPQHGEFTPDNLVVLGHAPICTLGGNGANAAYIAGRCGASVDLYTQLGDDAFGGLARGWVESAGCRVHAPARTSTAVNVTAANARHERATFFYAGEPISLPSFPKRQTPPSHLLVAGWPHPPPEVMATSFAATRKRGIFTGLDVGPILGRPWTLSSLRGVLKSLDLFISNEYELLRITRQLSIPAALVSLRRTFTGHIVIKCGVKGAIWVPKGDDHPLNFPGHRIKAVNTVGAGDSFNGALFDALVRGADFSAAMKVAARIAANVVASGKGVLSFSR